MAVVCLAHRSQNPLSCAFARVPVRLEVNVASRVGAGVETEVVFRTAVNCAPVFPFLSDDPDCASELNYSLVGDFAPEVLFTALVQLLGLDPLPFARWLHPPPYRGACRRSL